MGKIHTINDLLRWALVIPNYQRPYKWSAQNINTLLSDLDEATSNSSQEYRVGTIILHKDITDPAHPAYNIVDGQQRILSFALLNLYLNPAFRCTLLDHQFTHKISRANIHDNYIAIENYLGGNPALRDRLIGALSEHITVVVICVDNVSEAFQLFDSQNARGKALDPHDLLKAYHLREMKTASPDAKNINNAISTRNTNNTLSTEIAMRNVVESWERCESKDIRDLFENYLFPIKCWSSGYNSHTFTSRDIDIYKGINPSHAYPYAKRTLSAMPQFQITEPFLSGEHFFAFVEHYLELIANLRAQIESLEAPGSPFAELRRILCDPDYQRSIGFRYVRTLFYCALVCYYDKFGQLDERAVRNLFTWAMMLRVDMQRLGLDSVNKYALGGMEDQQTRYTDRHNPFAIIRDARLHTDISNLVINTECAKKPEDQNWRRLHRALVRLNRKQEIQTHE